MHSYLSWLRACYCFFHRSVMELWKLILLITSLCLGIRTISDTDKLLEPVRNLIAGYLPEWISKPVIVCCSCMASFWGTIVCWWFHRELIAQHYNEFDFVAPLVIKWIVSCVIASFLNELAWSVIILIRSKIDYYRSHTKSRE